MLKTIIKRRKMTIGEAKDIENAIAQSDRTDALIDYIVACDYPEALEEVTDNESGL